MQELPGKRAALAILGVLVATGLARVLAMLATARIVGADLETAESVAQHAGLLVGVGMIAGSLVGAAALFTLVPRSSLALVVPSVSDSLTWLAASALLVGFTHFAGALLDRPLLEPDWVAASETAPFALLVVALLFVSIFEELYFRGLVQGVVASTRVGPNGAIVVTALAFSLAHLPDDAFRFADVFCSGLLLGLARRRTGSSLVSMPPHILGNVFVLVLLATS